MSILRIVKDAAPIHPRDRLLAAAQTLFATKGYRGTGVQEVVQAAGVTKPTLYYYFENKAGLYRTLVEKALGQRLEQMEKAAAIHATVQEKLSAIMQALLDYTRENTELMRIVFANVFSAPEEVPPEARHNPKAQAAFDYVNGLINHGLKTGELDPAYDSMALTFAIYGQFIIAGTSLLLNLDEWEPERGSKMVRIFFEGARRKSKR